MIKLFGMFVTGILAFISFNMGMDSINFSTGWTPWIAFPLTILMLVAFYLLYNSYVTEIVYQVKEVTLDEWYAAITINNINK